MGLNLSFSTSKDKNPISDRSQSGIVLNALQRSPFLFYPGFSDLMNYSNINVMSPLGKACDRGNKTAMRPEPAEK